MKMSIITSFGDQTCGSFLSLSDKDNAVSRTANFVKVFISVFIFSCTLLPLRFELFLNNVSGLSLKLNFELKPEVRGIKIVSNCFQTIHFPSWVAHSHFDLKFYFKFIAVSLLIIVHCIVWNLQRLQSTICTCHRLPWGEGGGTSGWSGGIQRLYGDFATNFCCCGGGNVGT